jgi:hypothetical protein
MANMDKPLRLPGVALMAPTPLVLDLLESPHTGTTTDPLIIASLVYYSRLNHVVAFRSNDIRETSDLAGGRVGILPWIDARPLQELMPAAVSIPVRDSILEAVSP